MSFLLCAMLVLASCSSSDDEGGDAGNRNANGRKGYSYRLEIPALNDNDIFVTHTTSIAGKENITYSLAHNAERKHCRWTAFTFDASNDNISWSRNNWKNTEWGGDPFQPDPDIPEEYLMTKDEINRNRFVRGHLVASYDRVYSKDANEQTFYYSNISPMLSDFNVGLWSDLENAVQKWGRNRNFCDTLYVVKGGTINDGYYRQVGTCKTVPSYYFMALLSRKNDVFNGIAFWFKHVDELDGTFRDYAITIDELEENTGIDFFCNLPDGIEQAVERMYLPSKWQ